MELKSLVQSMLRREPTIRSCASDILGSVLIRDVPASVPMEIVRLFENKELGTVSCLLNYSFD